MRLQSPAVLPLGARYRLLEAAGGISGAYSAGEVAGKPFLTAQILPAGSGALQVDLARSSLAFAPYLRSFSQQSAGRALDALSSAPPAALGALYDRLLNLDTTTLPAAIAGLSGEAHASTLTALFSEQSFFTRRLLQRAHAAAADDSKAPPLWVEIGGGSSSVDAAGSSRAKISQTHLMLGGESLLGADWRFGAAFAYGDSRLRASALSAHADLASYGLTLFGGRSWQIDQGGIWPSGKLKLTAGLGYAQHRVDSKRSSLAGQLSDDYRTRGNSIFAELAYALPGENFTIEPYLAIARQELRAGSLKEEGGAAALGAKGERWALETLDGGLRFMKNGKIKENAAAISAALALRHTYGDRRPLRRVFMRQAPGIAFPIAGAAIADDSLLFDLEAHLAIGKTSRIGIAINGELAARNRQNFAQLIWRKNF